MKEKIETIITIIDDIQDCIEYSNFPFMDKYLETFLLNYSKVLMDIVMYCNEINDEKEIHNSIFWTKKTSEIISIVNSKDVFQILDEICYETKDNLLELASECK